VKAGLPTVAEATKRLQSTSALPEATVENLREAKVGGAFGTNSELPGFFTQDVADMVETFVKLKYSLDTLILILNSSSDENGDLIL